MQKKLIVTYHFEEDMIPHIHSMNSVIPVSIFQEDCVIDFAAIMDRLGL